MALMSHFLVDISENKLNYKYWNMILKT